MSTERKDDPQKIKLRNVRISFPSLFQPKEPRDGKGKASYQANFLIPKKDKKLIALIEDTIDAAIEAFREKNPKARFPDYDELDKNEKCFRDGENKRGEPLYDGYEGCYVLAARNGKRPLVIDADRSPLIEQDGKPYAGCYVNGIVRIWIQSNENGQGVRCSLEGVQFYRDGEAFGAAPIDADEFDDESEDDAPRSRRGGRGEDDDRGSRRARGEDDDRSSRRGRGEDDDRGSRRGRGEDDDRGSRRGRDRDEEDRPRSRRRDETDDLV